MTTISANYMSHLESDGSQVYRFLVSNPAVRQIVTSQDFLDAAHAELGSAIARDVNKFHLQTGGQVFFGHEWTIYGDDTSVPTPSEKVVKYIDPPRQKGEFGKRWHARTNTKEILVSNRTSASAHITYAPGYRLPWTGPTYRDLCYAAQTGLFERYTRNSQWIVFGGWVWEGPRFNKVRKAQTREQLSTFPNVPEKDMLSFLRGLLVGQEKDNGIIVSCLSEANAGTMDALTSMAELPETVKSIIDACKKMTQMYVDTRNKAFRLYNKGKGNTPLGQSRETMLKNIRETADAISQVWLQYRYNIMPTVYMVEDLLKTLDTKLEEFVRFRKTKHKRTEVSALFDGWEANSQITTVHRVMIKRLLNVSMDNAKMHHLVLTNAAVTLWELTPFSFVFDWFINVGDILTSSFVSPSLRGQGSTYSWKQKGSITFTHIETKATVTFDIEAYRREVINPSSHVSLIWDPSVGWKRQLDALALGWSIHRTSVMKLITKGFAK